MATWKEIAELKSNHQKAKAISKSLLTIDKDHDEGLLSEWELKFLKSEAMSHKSLTTRQSEKLLQIRDDIQRVKDVGYGRFSVRLLLHNCFMARLDLSDDDAKWIEAKRTENPFTIRRRNAGRLLHCARVLNLIDEK